MPSIPLRKLGKDGPEVPAIGFGMFGSGTGVYGGVASNEDVFALLDRAYELGARFWDSSDYYGDSDALIGEWMRRTGKGGDIFVATKFGYVPNSPTFELNSSYEYAKKVCDERLKILGVDCIDLYYVHAVNPKTPIEQTMRAMAELKAEGKIMHIGLSNIGSTDLRRAVQIAPIACVQIEYSAFNRDIETERGTHLLATCRELGVSVVAYAPLGRGMLTTNFTTDTNFGEGSMRNSVFPRFQGENRDKNVEIIRRFATLAEKRKCSLPQLALAWLLAQGEDVFVIPGTKKIKYLEDNCGAADVKLAPEELDELRRFVNSTTVAGGVVPEFLEDSLFPTTAPEV